MPFDKYSNKITQVQTVKIIVVAAQDLLFLVLSSASVRRRAVRIGSTRKQLSLVKVKTMKKI